MTATPRELRVGVVIPAFNEQDSIARVIGDIPTNHRDDSGCEVIVSQIIVVDNGSTDNTALQAESAGALVTPEPRKGYGQACLTGIAALDHCDVVAFLDGDYSDYPEQLMELLAPIVREQADLVVGSRVLGESERGALLPQARWGNFIATRLLRLLYGVSYTDLGPFRAIRREALEQIRMEDRDFGWTVEMQIKAAREGLRSCEVPVRYRKRIGTSKISGTFVGSLRAGHKILTTICRYAR